MKNMTKTIKRKVGRPPINDEALLERLNIRLDQRMLAKIKSIQAKRIDGASDAQIIRELLAEALAAREIAN